MTSCRITVLLAVLAGFLTCAQAASPQVGIALETATGTLQGTLDLPEGSGPFPVVVVIAGSGPTDRDGNQPMLKTDCLKRLGEALSADGIAVLRYDKRGIAASAAAGPKESDLRFETYAADAAGWIKQLRNDKRFSHVAVIGHSEGSLLGMLAVQQEKADAFVSIAGSGRAAPVLLREQLATKLPPELKQKSDHIIDELVAGRTVAETPMELAALYRPSVQPYLISWFKHDPAKEIAALKMPVLIVQGTTDIQVSVADAKLLSAAMKDAQLELIEGMNHVLKQAKTPAEQQKAYTDPTVPLDPQLAGKLSAFLRTAMQLKK